MTVTVRGAVSTPGAMVCHTGASRSTAEVSPPIMRDIQAQAPKAVDEIRLPKAGAPYGSLAIDAGKCTLCLSCVGACPEAALADNPAAAALFATLSKSNRYSMCWRIQTAKRAETKAKHVAKFVEMLARGEVPTFGW